MSRSMPQAHGLGEDRIVVVSVLGAADVAIAPFGAGQRASARVLVSHPWILPARKAQREAQSPSVDNASR